MPKQNNPLLNAGALSEFGRSIDSIIRAERGDLDAALNQNQAQFERLDSRLDALAGIISAISAPIDSALDPLADLRESIELQQAVVTQALARADEAIYRVEATQPSAAEAAARLEATVQQVAALDQRLADAEGARDAAGAAAQRAAAEAASRFETAMQQVAMLDQRLADAESARDAAGAAAQRAAAEAASQLDAVMQDRARFEALAMQQAHSQGLALAVAQERLAAAVSDLADARSQLAVLNSAHLQMLRENGRLEGQLAAQEEAHAARIADAVAASRDLADQLDSSEQALANARQHAIARQADLEAASSEADRLGQSAARLTQQLADMTGRHDSLQTQAAELLAERDCHSRQIEAMQAQASELMVERDGQSRHIEALQAQAAAQLQALHVDIAQLRARIVECEQQLEQASGLMEAIPDPLADLHGVPAAIVRWLAGKTWVRQAADYRSVVRHWQTGALPPLGGPRSQAEKLSLDSRFPAVDVALKDGEHVMMADERPITSVPEMLAPDGLHFIHVAYQALLGRAPDPEGAAHYLARLRAGEHKLMILKQLRGSAEGRTFVPGVAGLDRAIRRYRLANLPLIGAVIAPLIRAEQDTPITIALRRMEQNFAAQIAQVNRPMTVLPMSDEFRGALSWIDGRIGRLLELSEDIRQAGISGAVGQPGNGLHVTLNGTPVGMADLEDQTGSRSLDDVLVRVERQLASQG